MIIGDEIKGLAFVLQLDGRAHHPEIIAQMQRAGRLDARKNSHARQVNGEKYPQESRKSVLGVGPSTDRRAKHGVIRGTARLKLEFLTGINAGLETKLARVNGEVRTD